MFKPFGAVLQCVCLLVLLLGNTLDSAQAIYLKFQYGGEWVSVGDTNLGWMVYSEAYNHFDNNGGAYQGNAGGYQSQQVCLDGKANLPGWQVFYTVTGQAAYGNVPSSRLNGWQMRDLLIHTMWDGVKKLTDPTGWQVCVPKTTNNCRFLHPCANQCWKGASGCTDVHWGHRMPSILRVNVYNNDGSLRPEFFQLTLSNYGTSGRGKLCSNGMKSFGIASGLIPGIGSYVKSLVGVMCLF